MTDIVERLRKSADAHAELGMSDLIVKAREAADEIDRLGQQLRAVLLHVTDLREQLKKIPQTDPPGGAPTQPKKTGGARGP